MKRRGGTLALATLAFAAACSQHDDDLIRVEVQKLTLSSGEAASAAADKVASYGRRALPSVEAAMHIADESGRKNLVLALRRIGDAEGVPLLLHIAAYDAAPDVRREAEWTLKSWSVGSDARAEKARDALRRLDEIREREEAG